MLAAMHAGTEYQVQPSYQQRTVAQTLTASGVFNLVYGHHAHQTQPWTKLNGTWVLYGLSNFVGQMKTNTPASEEGIVADLTFQVGASGTWELAQKSYVPIYTTHAVPGSPARVVRATDPGATT